MLILDKPRYKNLTPFLNWVRPISAALVNGTKPPSNNYNYGPVHSAIAYYFTGEEVFRLAALQEWEKHVTAEEALINAGQTPKIASDSYLHIGGYSHAAAAVLGWCKPSQSLIDRTVPYMEQALFNLHNYKLAKWGGIDRPWTGWVIAAPLDPANNYFASFASATLWWDAYQTSRGVTKWSDKARWMVEQIVQVWSNVKGGGSQEGTGYGRAKAGFHAVVRVREEQTGEKYPGMRAHAAEDIRYLIHATLPSMTHITAIGDQSNESTHIIAEGDRDWMVLAAALADDPVARANAAWWLARIKVGYNANPGYATFNKAILPQEEPQEPGSLTLLAETVGHYFRRSDWTQDADWFLFSAGPNDQSHEAHDQGSISVFSGRQIILASQNMWSHSGILQNTMYQNTVLFQSGDTFLNQVRNKTRLNMVVEGNKITVDMTPSMPSILTAAGATWRRTIETSGKAQRITDDLNLPSSVKAYRTLNTPIQPVVVNGNTVLGPVTISGFADVIDWKTEPAPKGDIYKAGYGMRIPLKHGSNVHTITYPVGFGGEEPVETVEELKARIVTLEAEKVALTSSVNTLRAVLTDCDAQIVALQGQLAAKNGEILTLKNTVKEREATIKSQAEALKQCDDQITTLNGQLVDASQRMKAYTAEIAAKDEEIAQLKKKLADMGTGGLQALDLMDSLKTGVQGKVCGIDPVAGLVFVEKETG